MFKMSHLITNILKTEVKAIKYLRKKNLERNSINKKHIWQIGNWQMANGKRSQNRQAKTIITSQVIRSILWPPQIIVLVKVYVCKTIKLQL